MTGSSLCASDGFRRFCGVVRGGLRRLLAPTGSSMRRRCLAVGFGGLLAALVVVPVAFALLVPVGVKTSGAREQSPAASGSWLGWSQNAARHPHRFNYNAYVQDGANPRVKVNLRGTGYAGGFDGTLFAFQRVLRGNGDIKLYDVVSHARPAVPDGVNTPGFEYAPTLSSGWMLFGRYSTATRVDRVILRSMTTSERRSLDMHSGLRLTPGQVNGDWAVWGGEAPTFYATVHSYQISTDTRRTVPLPVGKAQYAPSVASDGRVFYVRGAPLCGKHAVIREWAPAPSSINTALVALPPGYDVFKTYFDESTSTLYFDRYNCASGGLNIYKVAVP